ncbi:MAG: hypothetical protein U0800_06790 [Isosphaeraceae bacterium]
MKEDTPTKSRRRRSVLLILATFGWMIFVTGGITTRLLGKDGGTYTITKSLCKEDSQQTNGCQFGSNTSCTEPLSHSMFFCGSFNQAKFCAPAGNLDTCLLTTNKSCGRKKYCDTTMDVKDADGNPIDCSGAPDVCVNGSGDPPGGGD